jgi:hypothetical protein
MAASAGGAERRASSIRARAPDDSRAACFVANLTLVNPAGVGHKRRDGRRSLICKHLFKKENSIGDA